MSPEEYLKLSPEEQAKLLEQAQKEAQAAWDKLSPEEQEKAKIEAERLIQESAREHQEMLDMIAKMREEGVRKNAAPADGMPASATKPAPKFCTNCGSPVSGGNFCTNCGNPL